MNEARELAKQRIIRMEQELKSLEQELTETHDMNLCDKIRSLKNVIAWARHNDHIPIQYPTMIVDPENYAVARKIERGSGYKCTKCYVKVAKVYLKTHVSENAMWFNNFHEARLCGKCIQAHNEYVEERQGKVVGSIH